MYIRHTLEAHFREASAHFPVMIVTGVRQVGKATFLQELADDVRTYISRDDPRIVELARVDPAQFMQRYLALEAGAASGAILETWILDEILESWRHRGKSASPGRNSVHHFGTLARLGLPTGPGGQICLAESSLPLGQGVVTIPVGAV